MSRRWQISIYDSLDKVWETEVPFRRLTKKTAERLLPALLAKYHTEDEIIGALLTKHSGLPQKNKLLNVTISYGNKPNTFSFMCGENPHVTARVVGQE